MLAGCVILLTRRSRPGMRYGLLSILFVLFLLTAGTTFVLQLHPAAAEDRVVPIHVTETPLSSGLLMEEAVNGKMGHAVPGLMDKWTGYFNAHALLIVNIWLILLSIRLARVLANLGAIHRLRHYRVMDVPGYWKDKVKELADLLHIRQPIALLESAIVKVPMMAGIFKPVILVPLGLLSQLPPRQVEAILLHELAHIRRKDYLVNLLQSCAEALFFFNPAVWWISSLIREERENCCDDIAVGMAGSKKEFVHALVSFQEYSDEAPSYALAFPGSGNHLLQRVKRILYQDDKTLDLREKFFLLVCIVVTGVLMLTVSPSSRANKQTAAIAVPARKAGAGASIGEEQPVRAAGKSIPDMKGEKPMPVHFRDTMPADPGSAMSLPHPERAAGSSLQDLPDTTPRRQVTMQTDSSGKEIKEMEGIMRNGDTTHYYGGGYEIVMDNNKNLMELYYQGRRIPDGEVEGYKELIRDIIKETVGKIVNDGEYREKRMLSERMLSEKMKDFRLQQQMFRGNMQEFRKMQGLHRMKDTLRMQGFYKTQEFRRMKDSLKMKGLYKMKDSLKMKGLSRMQDLRRMPYSADMQELRDKEREKLNRVIQENRRQWDSIRRLENDSRIQMRNQAQQAARIKLLNRNLEMQRRRLTDSSRLILGRPVNDSLPRSIKK